MGGRPRFSRGYSLKDLTRLPSGFYTIEREGIVYQLPHVLMHRLKVYFRDNQDKGPTLAAWYSDLPREDKNKVIRTGHQEDDTGFWPDE